MPVRAAEGHADSLFDPSGRTERITNMKLDWKCLLKPNTPAYCGKAQTSLGLNKSFFWQNRVLAVFNGATTLATTTFKASAVSITILDVE